MSDDDPSDTKRIIDLILIAFVFIIGYVLGSYVTRNSGGPP
jgi:hypothetical protein